MREVERRSTLALRRFVMLQITNIDVFGICVYTEAEVELESRGEPTAKKWQTRFQRLAHFEIPEEFRYLRQKLEAYEAWPISVRLVQRKRKRKRAIIEILSQLFLKS